MRGQLGLRPRRVVFWEKRQEVPEVETMLCIYVGDARDVVSRILTNHCSGNVEGSALRKAVAEAMGYRMARTKRASGRSTSVRIDLRNPRLGEARVSQYIRSGTFKYVICQSYDEAHDFQWYAIGQLDPLLNRDRKPWNNAKLSRYQHLLGLLKGAPSVDCGELRERQSGPGVYAFFRDEAPGSMSA